MATAEIAPPAPAGDAIPTRRLSTAPAQPAVRPASGPEHIAFVPARTRGARQVDVGDESVPTERPVVVVPAATEAFVVPALEPADPPALVPSDPPVLEPWAPDGPIGAGSAERSTVQAAAPVAPTAPSPVTRVAPPAPPVPAVRVQPAAGVAVQPGGAPVHFFPADPDAPLQPAPPLPPPLPHAVIPGALPGWDGQPAFPIPGAYATRSGRGRTVLVALLGLVLVAGVAAASLHYFGIVDVLALVGF